LEYAEKEIHDPVRIVTTTVALDEASEPLLPVKTDKGVPRDLAFEVIQKASALVISAPVRAGDVLVENILNTGVNLIATRSFERIEWSE
jgi:CxxC motif-containing protein